MNHLTRRAVMTALAGLSAGGSVANTRDSPVLVAYFSRSGNTRVIAGLIHRALGTDLFEIRPATPYPDDYLKQVEVATRERDREFEPPLAQKVSNIARYNTVYLGFPIWAETAPAIIRTFLKTHDLSDKTLIPFITHGGYGLGSSHAVLKSHAPAAKIGRGFTMQADQERKTMETVNYWLKEKQSIPSSS
jgi:flavodoxin